MTIGRKIKDIFGYDRSKLGWYRDLALGLTAGMSLIFGMVFASEFYSGRGSSFDLKVSLGCFAIMMLCVLVSPDKETVLIGAVSTPGAFALLKFVTTGSRAALLTFACVILALVVMAICDELIRRFRRKRKSV